MTPTRGQWGRSPASSATWVRALLYKFPIAPIPYDPKSHPSISNTISRLLYSTPQMDLPAASHIPLQRCPDLGIISDTPKGCIVTRVFARLLLLFLEYADALVGRGVFATRDIPAKTVIDVCPVLVLGIEENKKHLEHTSLYHYT